MSSPYKTTPYQMTGLTLGYFRAALEERKLSGARVWSSELGVWLSLNAKHVVLLAATEEFERDPIEASEIAKRRFKEALTVRPYHVSFRPGRKRYPLGKPTLARVSTKRAYATDREALEQMLHRARIRFRYGERPAVDESSIEVHEEDSRLGYTGNVGYSGFFAQFVFGEDGSLRAVGAWE